MLGIIFEILYLVAAIVPLVFYIYLKKQKGKSESRMALADLILITFIWLLLEFLASLGFIPNEWQLYIARLMHSFALLVTWLVIRFVLIFLGKYRKKVFLVSFIPIFIFFISVINFSDLVVIKLLPESFFWEVYYTTGPLFPIFSFFVAFPVFLSTLFVVQNYFKTKRKNVKRQLGYIAIGLFFPLLIGIFTNLIFPILKIDFPRLANFSALALSIFLSLAIYNAEAFGVKIEKISFKTKVFLIYFLTIIVSIFIFYFFVIYFARVTYEEEAGEAILLSMQNISANFNHSLDGRVREMGIIAQDKLIKESLRDIQMQVEEEPENKDSQEAKFNFELIEKYLNNFNYGLEKDLYLDIYITDRDGVNLNFSPYSQDLETRKDLLGKVRKSSAYIHDTTRAQDQERAYFKISRAILSENEEFLGMITSVIDLGTFYEQLGVDLNFSFEEEGNILRAMNQEGEVFYSSQEGEAETIDSKIKNLMLNRIKANESGYYYERDKYYHVKDLYVFTNLNYDSPYGQDEGWVFFLEYDTEEFLSTIERIKTMIIVIVLLVLAFTILIFYYISRIFSKPLEKLEEGVRKIEGGNLDYKLKVETRDEIGQLSQAFNQMVGSIKDSRKNVDKKVKEQTKKIRQQRDEMEKQKKAILNILEDVEEAKVKVEQERNRIKAMLYSIGDGVFVINKNKEIVLFNKAAEDISGYSASEIEGKRYDQNLKFKNKEGKSDDFIDKAFKSMEITSMGPDTELIKKNGDRVPVSDSASPLKDSEGNLSGAVIVFKDVTKERAIDRAKTEFVSLASHQLRTPLSTINWYAEMLLDGDAGKLNKDQEEFLSQIYNGNKRMVDLVNSLLNVSRIEMGTLEVKPESLNFAYIAESVLNELKPTIQEKKLKIKEKIPKNLPKIKADKNLVRIIFQNLLSNAVKYTPEEGKVSLSLSKEKDNLLIEVCDSGVGIPKKDHEKIFTKLFRADNVKERDTEGTGLGLYVVKAIVDQAGGEIWFKSAKNKGTTFYVKFPFKGMEAKKGSRTLNPTK